MLARISSLEIIRKSMAQKEYEILKCFRHLYILFSWEGKQWLFKEAIVAPRELSGELMTQKEYV